MSLDNIIVAVLILGTIGFLVAIELHSRYKNKQAKSNPEDGE